MVLSRGIAQGWMEMTLLKSHTIQRHCLEECLKHNLVQKLNTHYSLKVIV